MDSWTAARKRNYFDTFEAHNVVTLTLRPLASCRDFKSEALGQASRSRCKSSEIVGRPSERRSSFKGREGGPPPVAAAQ